MSQTNRSLTRDGVLGLDSGLEALQASTDFRGPVESLDGHHCNDHFAQIYESDAERFAASVPFVRHGLSRGERCMCVVDESTEAEVQDAMREAGIAVDDAVESGALTFHTVQETYLADGAFDPDEMIGFYADVIEEADDDYTALRIVAEMTWLQEDDTMVEQFMEYESKVNDLFDDEDCIALCQYDRRGFDPEIIRDIVQTHPHLIYDDTACHNFYYTPPEEFFRPDEPAREVDRMLATLRDRTEAKVQLQEHERDLDLFRTLIDRSNDSVYVLDPETAQFLDANETACRDLGYDYDELLDMQVTDVERAFPDLDAWQSHVEAVRNEGAVLLDGRHERADGSTFPVEVNVVHEVLDQEYMLAIARDVTERKERERFQQELHEAAAATEFSFEQKVQQILELGREFFDVEFGLFTRTGDDSFEVLEDAGAPAELQAGTEFPLETSYCREVLARDEAVYLTEASSQGWVGDPAYAEFGLEQYFGTTVSLGPDTYGTICFGAESARIGEVSVTERSFLELMSQCLSYELEREHREAQLAALNEMSRDLMNAETFGDIADESVRHAESTLQLPVTAVMRYDSTDGTLVPSAQTASAADELPTEALCERSSGPAWDAFVSGEVSVVEDLSSISGVGDGLAAVVAVPLGTEGLFLTGVSAPDGVCPAELDFIEATAATVNDACVRADRENQLQDREQTLEAQNETLQRLNSVNDIIRSIDKALVQASSRGEIENVVCEQLSKSGPYELAWVGEHDSVEQRVVPHEWAGAERGYVDGMTVRTDGTPEEQGPAGHAAVTGEPQVVDDILTDERCKPWRQSALNRGYHAVGAFPLVYEESMYGVLVVYAGEPNVFGDLERSVLSELADNVAHAINAVESKRALVSDEVTELEFTVEEPVFTVMELAEETGCEYAHEYHVARSGEGIQLFFTTRGVSASEVLDFRQRLYMTDVELVSERAGDGEHVCHFQGTLTDDSFAATVLEHGGRLTEFSVADGTANITVNLAPDASVREFATMITDRYQGTRLTAQRTRERATTTFGEFRTMLTDALTDRQLEVLQTAYFSGYFEQPRTMTASEIADTLDIAQPTLNSHLRIAQRKLCKQLFEEQALSV